MRWTRAVVAVLLVVAASSTARAEGSPDAKNATLDKPPPFAMAKLPPATLALFDKAFAGDRDWPLLRERAWPDVAKLERAVVRYTFEGRRDATDGWFIAKVPAGVWVLRDVGLPVLVEGAEIAVEKPDFAQELANILAEPVEDLPVPFARGLGDTFRAGVPDFLLAVYAAAKGRRDDVAPLLTRARRIAPRLARDVYEELAWRDHQAAILTLAEGDAERAAARFAGVVRDFPSSAYAEEARALTAGAERVLLLRRQRAAEAPPAADAPADARARALVRALLDVRIVQAPPPSAIDVLGHETTRALAGLKRAAIPALIDALADGTPTRTVYTWRESHPGRYVWRVRDLAYHLLRELTGETFGDPPFLASDETAAAVARRARAWWAAQGER